ncbi:RluA family pseudouridine synthase [Cerasibacillus terrae]|uniref:Pseudouridine synthase n=1 Tax=Cerasibacillus terrae TaxID=2498845 RepID=A0A5C8P390_9BACI|nr:RluA family pseudouridine synthase [Cerasibacillus terrae]TXL67613.1 RluA family pseudouridine synthase [Cerasibacillus terrae]
MKKNHLVTNQEENIRIDKLLTSLQPDRSRSEIQTWIKSHLVTINNQPTKANYRCMEGDVIKWNIPKEETLSLEGENIPLSIVYEDETLIIINKPSGMVVHPASGHIRGTLVNALLYHYDQLSTVSGEDRPGIVHRLDKDTSGLLVVAKTDQVHQKLIEQFKARLVKRTYEVVVHGTIGPDDGLIDAPIGRDPKQRQNMTVIDGGKEAITHFHVLKRFTNFTHVECQLETGRTHQIRVHMKYIGHPVLGDPKYGPRRKNVMKTGQVLHAKYLQFTHPINGKKLTFEVEPPKDFQEIIHQLEKMS